MRQIDSDRVAVMTFNREEDAAKVLAVTSHNFCDVTVIVKPAPKMDLLTLNDFCLIQIFRQLTMLDLCSVADTCGRFSPIAPLAINKSNNVISNLNGRLENHELAKILKKYGNYIVQLDVKNHTNSEQLSNLIASHCGEELRSLKLIHFRFHKELVPQLLQIFTNLEALRLWGTKIDFGDILFPECPQLVDLKLADAKIPSSLFQHYYPKLKYLDLRELNITNRYPLPEFLNKHTHLQKFSIGKIRFAPFDYASKVLPKVTHLYDYWDYNYLRWLSDDNRIVKLFTFSNFKVAKNITFLHLKELHFNLDKLDVADAINFLRRHMRLNEIIMLQHERGPDEVLNKCVEFIVDNFPQLKRLEMNIQDRESIDTSECLSRWQHIRALKIGSFLVSGQILSSFLTNMVSIDSLVQLELIDVNINSILIDAIAKFKNLRYLELVDVNLRTSDIQLNYAEELLQQPEQTVYSEHEQNTTSSLVHLAHQLEKLNTLVLKLRFRLRQGDYTEILNAGQIDQIWTTPNSQPYKRLIICYGRIVVEREIK